MTVATHAIPDSSADSDCDGVLYQHLILQAQCAQRHRQLRRAARLYDAALNTAVSQQFAARGGNLSTLLVSLVNASRQLALELCTGQRWGEAVDLLDQLHRRTLELCQNPALERSLRLDALGTLDKTLMLLTTMLGHLGRNEAVQRVISHTRGAVDLVEQELFWG